MGATEMTEDEKAAERAERHRVSARESYRRKAATKPKLKGPAQCGTRAGANRHRRLGEEVCEPCKDAERQASRARYEAKNEGRKGRPRLS